MQVDGPGYAEILGVSSKKLIVRDVSPEHSCSHFGLWRRLTKAHLREESVEVAMVKHRDQKKRFCESYCHKLLTLDRGEIMMLVLFHSLTQQHCFLSFSSWINSTDRKIRINAFMKRALTNRNEIEILPQFKQDLLKPKCSFVWA